MMNKRNILVQEKHYLGKIPFLTCCLTNATPTGLMVMSSFIFCRENIPINTTSNVSFDKESCRLEYLSRFAYSSRI